MIFVLAGGLLVGCSDATPPLDPAECTPPYGLLRVCATGYSGAPYAGATAFAREAGSEELPIQTRTGDDGCVHLELPPGAWTVWAETNGCRSEEQSVEVETCAVTTAEANAAELCWDG